MAFEGFDIAGFWTETDYGRKAYVGGPFTREDVERVEKALGYTLPPDYVWFMHQHNGGLPVPTCFPTATPTAWAEDHISIEGFLSIGGEKDMSLLGQFGSRFWIEEWQYPDIGVAICDCPSAGHDMVFLDYSLCGPTGLPRVVHIDQEYDYRITPLADSFEAFVRGLRTEEAFSECRGPHR